MAPRRSKLFPTPDDAETAFYEAFERGDLAAMMAVWDESDDIVCIHPQGPRLTGFDAVRDSWMQIFSGATRMRVTTSAVKAFNDQGVSVHAVIETLGAAGGQGPTQSVCATNVYVLTDGGWRMVVHHATHLAEPSPSPDAAPSPTHTLH